MLLSFILMLAGTLSTMVGTPTFDGPVENVTINRNKTVFFN